MHKHINVFDSKPTVGQFATGYSEGPGYRSTWSGVYIGINRSEWDGQPYHYFTYGEINGIKQSIHGFSVATSAYNVWIEA
jgi:hypothetical protein